MPWLLSHDTVSLRQQDRVPYRDEEINTSILLMLDYLYITYTGIVQSRVLYLGPIDRQ